MASRFRQRALILFVCLWLAAPAYGAAIATIDAISVTVSDLANAKRFYSEVLTFAVEGEYEIAGEDYEALFGVSDLRVRIARMRLGEEAIELMQFLTPGGRPIPVDARSNDRSFQHIAIIVSDMAQAYAQLRKYKVQPVSGAPQRLPDWNPNAGGIEAFYFRDPDGHALEILHFPAGKGAPRWQVKDRLFLGIDHTAITVADTAASLQFYRDTLGLVIAGTSENWGIEQERLNNVVGAHLRITALRASGGPGVELLHYLAPRGARAMPDDTRANDLWHWHIVMQSPSPDALDQKLVKRGYRAVSPRIVDLTNTAHMRGRARLYRDADGHAVMLNAR